MGPPQVRACLAALVLSAAPLACLAEAPRAPAGAQRFQVLGGWQVPVRSRPSVHGEILAWKQEHDVVEASGRTSGKWVELASGGWMSTVYVLDGRTPILAPAPPAAARYYEVVEGWRVPVRARPDAGGEILAWKESHDVVESSRRTSGKWVELLGGGWMSTVYVADGRTPILAPTLWKHPLPDDLMEKKCSWLRDAERAGKQKWLEEQDWYEILKQLCSARAAPAKFAAPAKPEVPVERQEHQPLHASFSLEFKAIFV